jgi:hypothetical protein
MDEVLFNAASVTGPARTSSATSAISVKARRNNVAGTAPAQGASDRRLLEELPLGHPKAARLLVRTTH